jgi:colanic acid/amylovoran biosynthesis glycosyltransferase
MPRSRRRVGYVAKVFPRLSETFIVSELLAQERAGLDVEVFSLRRSEDRGAHGAHARLRAPVTYVGEGEPTLGALLAGLAEASPTGDLEAMVALAGQQHPREVAQALELARHVRAREIDHLHAHFANVAATVARMAAALAGITYSVTAHAKDIFHEDVTPEHLHGVLTHASAVISVSDFNVAHLRRLFPEAAARVHRVYNGIELAHFPFLFPAERAPRILGVGRLVEKKGFGDLIDACAVLTATGREFECRIVGQGALEKDLRARVAHHGLEEVVTFAGPASQEQVREEMHAAAAVAAPCVVGADGNRDGLPTVLLEAMALGTPCVATSVTGIPEILHHERTGLEIPEHSPVTLAAALARLLDDVDLRMRLAARARLLIEERFDIDHNVAGWRDVVLTEVPHAHRVRVR